MFWDARVFGECSRPAAGGENRRTRRTRPKKWCGKRLKDLVGVPGVDHTYMSEED